MANPRPIRVDDDVWEALNALPGKSINDKLRTLLLSDVIQSSTEPVASDSPALSEVLELVRSMAAKVERLDELPDREDVEFIVDTTMQKKIDERAANRPAPATVADPSSIPGVQRGYAGITQPRRETGTERAIREKAEREERARAQSSAGDDPSMDFSDEYVGN